MLKQLLGNNALLIKLPSQLKSIVPIVQLLIMGNACCESDQVRHNPAVDNFVLKNRETRALDSHPVSQIHQQVIQIESFKINQQKEPEDGPLLKKGTFLQTSLEYNERPFGLPVFSSLVKGSQQGDLYQPFRNNTTGQIYKGEWKNHRYHGEGVLVYPNRDYVIGSFKDGKPNGYCRVVLLSRGSYYEGEVVNGFAEGKGVYADPSRSYKYEGSFSKNKPHGSGIEYQGDSVFKGKLNYGNKQQGELRNPKLNYIGSFFENMFDGHGKLITPKGTYEGMFKANKKNGYGKFVWEDGAIYQGNYVNDLKEGKGKFVSADKKYVYDGNWKNGRMDGEGTFTEDSNGKKIYKAEWKEGSYVRNLKYFD